MSVDIKVSLSSLGIHDQVSPIITSAIRNAVQSSLSVIRDKWIQEAQNKLGSQSTMYLAGLDYGSIKYPLDEVGFSGSIQLLGETANALEHGTSAIDMKIGFGKSTKITKTKSGGWYLTVPFRHTQSGKRAMPREIAKQAKKLEPGGRLSVPGEGDKSWTGYQHKSSIYNGLQRIVKSYQNGKTQNQYYTFRRVSNNSAPSSWWKPALPGAKIVDSMIPFAKQTFVSALKANLNEVVI